MDLQKELELFLDYYMPNQSSDIRDAVELDKSFHVINVPKLLAVSGLDESYEQCLTVRFSRYMINSSRRDGQTESLDELKHYLVRYRYENFND